MSPKHGATYRLYGDAEPHPEYLATIEDSELSGSVVAVLQRLPITQPDDEPVLFVHTDGSITDRDAYTIATTADLIEV
jgi:hypothetical protein